MDPIQLVNPKKDTTYAFILEAKKRNWTVEYMELNHLELRDGKPKAFMQELTIQDNLNHWYTLNNGSYQNLGDLDIILMRKDPPFDIEYIIATYVLEQAQKEGVMVVNNPRALRDSNEKIFASYFPQCCPPSLLTRSKESIIKFLQEQEKIVLKPTGKMGGQSIFVVTKDEPNTNVIIEEMTNNGNQFVQAQSYLPEIQSTGDKRIILIDGKPIEYGIARIPGLTDHRGNLAVGAECKGHKLTERDYWICNEIGPKLKEMGLRFVGIDIIGDYLTEINVTSPTGIREIDNLFNINVSSLFFDAIVTNLKK
ncbi:MAG: glutathione synthase [Crocinitomicaceae bacterium]|nr:glutathione synthase [Crocinitomicaceae bacterium]